MRRRKDFTTFAGTEKKTESTYPLLATTSLSGKASSAATTAAAAPARPKALWQWACPSQPPMTAPQPSDCTSSFSLNARIAATMTEAPPASATVEKTGDMEREKKEEKKDTHTHIDTTLSK